MAGSAYEYSPLPPLAGPDRGARDWALPGIEGPRRDDSAGQNVVVTVTQHSVLLGRELEVIEAHNYRVIPALGHDFNRVGEVVV